MITVTFNKETGGIRSVEVTGHGNYGDSGEDIVCAGISILTITILNGLTEIVGVTDMKREVAEGYTSFTIPPLMDPMMQDRANVLLETYELGVRATESAYGDYVQVIENCGGENDD